MVHVGHFLNGLQLEDYSVRNKKVKALLTNLSAFVRNFDRVLPPEWNLAQLHLNSQRLFVYAFSVSRSEHAMYLHRSSNDLVA